MPPYEVVTADVLKWLAEYSGEPFHALLCDPPYHLSAIVKRFAKATYGQRIHHQEGPFKRHATGFMGQTWDGGDIAFRPETWAAFLPVLHPGAFGMAFAGSRGWHRLAVAIEDAGYIIHPSIFGWLYGSGFPKATRIDTQIDREAGAERETVQRDDGRYAYGFSESAKKGLGMSDEAQARGGFVGDPSQVSLPATDLAKAWSGHRYGLQAAKPALEPIIVFQKPYESDRPIEDITRTGAGAINIDAGRVQGPKGNGVWGTSNEGTNPDRMFSGSPAKANYRTKPVGPQSDPRKRGGIVGRDLGISNADPQAFAAAQRASTERMQTIGRWPANFALAHAAGCVKVGMEEVHSEDAQVEAVERWACVPECPVRRLNDQAGVRASGQGPVVRQQDGGYNRGWRQGMQASIHGDSGYVSRFFFTAVEAAVSEADALRYDEKADQEERERGLLGVLPCVSADKPNVRHDGDPLWSETHVILQDGKEITVNCRRNPHPTVKPVDLVRWLARLLIPPAEYAPRRILIPFAGVGSEVIAAKQAEWEEAVGIELHERYAAIARIRLAAFVGMF